MQKLDDSKQPEKTHNGDVVFADNGRCVRFFRPIELEP